MRVEVESDEALGLSMPRRFHFDWRVIEVVATPGRARRPASRNR
jgi:hypothetical protein